MAVDFADKLQLTARALGCVTQKELCARFFDLNPKTQFTLQNSYKWMKGRSQPRSGAVYKDWAQLLDLGQSAQFLSECPYDVFAGLVSARYALDIEGTEPAAEDAQTSGMAAMLQGEYACYSPAWSKAARGQLIRGSLKIHLDAGGGLAALYEERVAGGTLSFTGWIRLMPRMLSAMLEDTAHGHALSLSFPPPLPPGTVLTGMMAGAAYHDFETRPMATRMLCVRSRQAPGELEQSNRYIDLNAEQMNEDLQALGYDLAADLRIGALCRDFLSANRVSSYLEIPMAETEALTMVFARLELP